MSLFRLRALYPQLSSTRLAASHSTSARQFKVTLDGRTLYIDEALAKELGWSPSTSSEGIPLRLRGCEPQYYAITPEGTDEDLLAQGTVESSRDTTVKGVIDYLKKSDAC
ncbi:hypothetical protein F5878DRAFT_569495 [Lentinula raphanica]|uniref:Uncharacterized protein n=1 Tax=Lentinula raphanica TaxID=153919 RepID=A0AA38NZS5_9AGAR|nr:hypothetical protein F5878DRAFT_569495 [Lentinula raphanica]